MAASEARLKVDRPTVVIDPWEDQYRSEEYLRFAIDDLAEEFSPGDRRFGVYILDGLDPRSSVGRAVELERFSETFDNDAGYLRDLYGEFEDVGATELICVVDHVERRPAGVMRIVRHTAEAGSRTINDLCATGDNGWGLTLDELWERAPLAATNPEQIYDVPTLAVAKAYQSGRHLDGVSRAICASVFQHALARDAKSLVCCFERIPALLVQAFTGNFWNEFDGVDSRPYYGAPDTIPMWANPHEHEWRVRNLMPELYAKFVQLIGLEKYHFVWPDGPPTWEEIEPDEFVDLRPSDLEPPDEGQASDTVIDLTDRSALRPVADR